MIVVSWYIRSLPPYPRRLIKRMVKEGLKLHAGTRWLIRVDYETRLAIIIDRHTGKKWYLLV